MVISALESVVRGQGKYREFHQFLAEQIADPVASFTGDVGIRSGRCLQCGLPASFACGGHCAAAFERGTKRNGTDRADQARPAPAADRRARSDGLAAGTWLQLA